MKTVLIFAGTTEGRELAELLDRNNVSCHVCVATEYGRQMIRQSENINVHTGRLDEEGMRRLIDEIGCDVIVDATHPYAVLVTESIKRSIAGKDVTYIRLSRKSKAEKEIWGIQFYENINQCILSLKNTEGNILLTTGSKALHEFGAEPEIKERLIARVIPGIESLTLCYEAGLLGNQIIAMQGPFSSEINKAIIREYNIKHLVTKDSGSNGGINEKLSACEELGVTVHLIRRPDENTESNEKVLSMDETVSLLEKILNVSFGKGIVNVNIAGIGPGNDSLMTKEVLEAISNADVIFGAKRMLEAVNSKAEKYPYYRKDEILPVLSDIASNRFKDTNAVILFSGDTGFFSGGIKLFDSLRDDDRFKVNILPGISSLSLLSARIGTDWQDAGIISMHGVNKEEWIPLFVDSVKHKEKTFFITSGVADINIIGDLLKENTEDYDIYLGYQLSYEDEKVMKLSPQECTCLEEKGLYAGLVVSKAFTHKYLVPVLSDDCFIRDKVPMTKEEIRKLSICQMQVKEYDTVYDIGSGSGSIAVQTAVLSPTVSVYAIECNPVAVDLINQNVDKAKLNNVAVIETMAPDGMEGLPCADVAFIGGSKGNLKEILDFLYSKNQNMRVVINAVSMETICETNSILDSLNVCDLTIEQISVNRVNKLGDYHMLSANNPVFIYSFNFC